VFTTPLQCSHPSARTLECRVLLKSALLRLLRALLLKLTGCALWWLLRQQKRK